jgi:protein involved in polysaccharide export with SLBB domain
MEPGKSWSCRRALVGVLLSLLAGCAANRGHVDQALLADRGAPARNQGVAEAYAVHCPDLLQVTVAERPEVTGPKPVGADGRIDLGAAGRPKVEGRSPSEVALMVAELAGVSPDRVHVQVAEFKSQKIYLFGEVTGLQRAVPYQGQETVLDLLQRVGGITPGAAPNDVYVVRPRIAEGQAPEVFHVNLGAIVLNQDQRTNLRLEPFDQVYVGETRQASREKCIPPCLRPLYETFWGLSHRGGSDKATR